MGIRIPMCQGCGVGVLRIATPACALVRNDMVYGDAAYVGGGVWSPRPTEGRKCLRRVVGDADPYEV